MIKGLHVAGERIILDETILTAVQSHVGGTIGHRGDAGDSLEWLCLRGTGVQGPWVLWLMSWWKFTHGRVGGFRWQRVEPTAQFDSRCQTLPDGRGGVELPIALQLGIVQSQVLRILGQPSKRVGHTLLYRHEHEVTIKNQLFKTLNTMAVILRGQAVWATEAWRHGNHQQFEVLISAGR